MHAVPAAALTVPAAALTVPAAALTVPRSSADRSRQDVASGVWQA